MPMARRPTPPPQEIKSQVTVLESLNAWTGDDDDEEKPKRRVPLGYTPLAGNDNAPLGWRQLFDSESDNFNFGIGMVIIANAIVIGLETDLGRGDFVICEHVFNTVFVCEMLTRIMQIGVDYFTTPAYLFDCSLVVSGSLDLWILPAISGGKGEDTDTVGYQFSVMRLLRILRLLRVLRVIRLFRMFGQLLLIVKAFGKALQVVLLMSILVFIMIYALGIVFTQLVGHNAEKWAHDQEEIIHYFGTIAASMTTLFCILFGSSWDQIVRLLSQVYPTGMVLLFFGLYMVVTVALLALIVGLISESLIIAQQEFKARTLAKFSSKKKALAKDISEELYALLDDEKDEFDAVESRDLKQAVKGNVNLISNLAAVGVSLDEHGIGGLVDSMSKDGSVKVGIEHFVEKLTNLSGGSSASSVVDVKYDVLRNRQQMQMMDKKMDDILAKLNAR